MIVKPYNFKCDPGRIRTCDLLIRSRTGAPHYTSKRHGYLEAYIWSQTITKLFSNKHDCCNRHSLVCLNTALPPVTFQRHSSQFTHNHRLLDKRHSTPIWHPRRTSATVFFFTCTLWKEDSTTQHYAIHIR